MKVTEAYRIIGATPNSDLAQIGHLYRARLQKLQLLLIPGHSVTVRQKAQQQVTELAEAWELLQKNAARYPTHKRKQSPNYRKNSAAASGVSPHKVEAGMGFVIVVVIMYVIMRLCFTQSHVGTPRNDNPASANQTKELPAADRFRPHVEHPVADPTVEIPTASMRVLSVPWCEVELDGRNLGTSSQTVPFELKAGRHLLVLQQGKKVLKKQIQLKQGQLTVIKVDFKKGQINVEQQ